MFQIRLLVPLLVVGFVVASGCSSRKPVHAIVTLDGKTVDGATVVLSKEGLGGTISGSTAADGTVTLNSSSNDGILPGDYKVVVTKVKAMTGTGGTDPKGPDAMKMMKGMLGKKPKSELPEKYSNFSTTPLILKVPANTNPAKIELTSAK